MAPHRRADRIAGACPADLRVIRRLGLQLRVASCVCAEGRPVMGWGRAGAGRRALLCAPRVRRRSRDRVGARALLTWPVRVAAPSVGPADCGPHSAPGRISIGPRCSSSSPSSHLACNRAPDAQCSRRFHPGASARHVPAWATSAYELLSHAGRLRCATAGRYAGHYAFGPPAAAVIYGGVSWRDCSCRAIGAFSGLPTLSWDIAAGRSPFAIPESSGIPPTPGTVRRGTPRGVVRN